MRLSLISDKTEIALKEKKTLEGKYSFEENPSNSEAIIILGGDGFMLHSMHNYAKFKKPLYGMNCGTVGFLLNTFSKDNLNTRIEEAKKTIINPLQMEVVNNQGKEFCALSYNEVSLLRETKQSANISIKIDGKIRLDELIGDGILVATPAGSSAYNYSVRGPIIPLDSDLLSLTPISPFRPRGWRGALISSDSEIEFIVNNSEKRVVSAVADYFEFRDIKKVKVKKSKENTVTLLFDHHNPLEDKLLSEQFL
jgi:NAD+ kinase